jgi:hypothetical protein
MLMLTLFDLYLYLCLWFAAAAAACPAPEGTAMQDPQPVQNTSLSAHPTQLACTLKMMKDALSPNTYLLQQQGAKIQTQK